MGKKIVTLGTQRENEVNFGGGFFLSWGGFHWVEC